MLSLQPGLTLARPSSFFSLPPPPYSSFFLSLSLFSRLFSILLLLLLLLPHPTWAVNWVARLWPLVSIRYRPRSETDTPRHRLLTLTIATDTLVVSSNTAATHFPDLVDLGRRVKLETREREIKWPLSKSFIQLESFVKRRVVAVFSFPIGRLIGICRFEDDGRTLGLLLSNSNCFR